jgi:hypothetical protein
MLSLAYVYLHVMLKFKGFLIHTITILQVQRYTITIRLFGELPL